MTFSEFIQEVNDHHAAVRSGSEELRWYDPHYRWGQAYFNVLCDVRPSIAEAIRGSAIYDPFHAERPDDPRVLAAITFTHENWEVLDRVI